MKEECSRLLKIPEVITVLLEYKAIERENWPTSEQLIFRIREKKQQHSLRKSVQLRSFQQHGVVHFRAPRSDLISISVPLMKHDPTQRSRVHHSHT
jgi:hypothetical protein